MQGSAQPLVVKTDFTFPRPDQVSSPVVTFNNGDQFWIACPGGYLRTTNRKMAGLNARGELMTCQGGTRIANTKNKIFDYDKIVCIPYVPGAAPKLKQIEYHDAASTCVNQYTQIDVGYSIADEKFVPVFTTCFDETNLSPVYSRETVTPWARQGQHGTRPNIFKGSSVYGGRNIANLYATVHTILTKLGINTYSTPLNSLVKGHLAANGDFLYKFQRDATFFYPNVAPQLAKFNEGNWNKLENRIAYIAENIVQNDATVLTGTLNVLSLVGTKGAKEVFLVPKKSKIPVPEYFWKFVFYSTKQVGLVFFGVNNDNPGTEQGNNFLAEICEEDVFSLIQNDWGLQNINNGDKSLGIIYACKLNRLRHALMTKIVPNVLNEFGVNAADVKMTFNPLPTTTTTPTA